MTKHLTLTLTLLVAGLGVTSCQQDEIVTPDANELYVRDFIKQFGIVDSDHDWTAAQHVSVTVKTSAPTDIRVLADFDGATYRFGDFKNISGTQTLTFDLPAGAENLRLNSGSGSISCTPGSTVTFDSRSRAFVSDTNNNGLVWATEGEWMLFQSDVIKYYVSKEDDETAANGKVGEVPEEEDNLDNEALTENFWMVSQGPFVTYPIYWQSNLCHEVGIFYIPEGGTVDDGIHVPFHRNKFFEDGCVDLQSCSYLSGEEYELTTTYIWYDKDYNAYMDKDNNSEYWYRNWEANPNLKVGDTLSGEVITRIEISDFQDAWSDNAWPGSTQAIYKKTVTYYYETEATYGTWTNVGAMNSGEDADYYRAQAYTINVPEGCVFCFYIDAYLGTTTAEAEQTADNKYLENHLFLRRVYSSATMNQRSGILPHSDSQTTNPDRKYSWAVHHVAEVDGQDYTYWSFEDWGGLSNDNLSISNNDPVDLNDLVWVIASNYPPEQPYTAPTVTETIETKTATVFPWVVACEDLGGTYDHDFNDVVFGVQHEAGSQYAYITALAAGGTLPVRLYYKGVEVKGGSDASGDQYTVYSPVSTKEFSEWHQWFGNGSTTVTNASDFKVGATVRIKVDDDFTMSGSASNPDITIDSDNRLGGFHVEVDQKGGTVNRITAPVQSSNPGTNIPQLFVTTASFEWPKESVAIYSTHRGDTSQSPLGESINGYTYYPNSFQGWVTDATNNAGFHTQKASDRSSVVRHGWTGYDIPIENTSAETDE